MHSICFWLANHFSFSEGGFIWFKHAVAASQPTSENTKINFSKFYFTNYLYENDKHLSLMFSFYHRDSEERHRQFSLFQKNKYRALFYIIFRIWKAMKLLLRMHVQSNSSSTINFFWSQKMICMQKETTLNL